MLLVVVLLDVGEEGGQEGGRGGGQGGWEGAREAEEGTREVKRGAKQVKRVYEFLQVDASAHIKMEPCMQPNLFYCDFYQYFMKLKE